MVRSRRSLFDQSLDLAQKGALALVLLSLLACGGSSSTKNKISEDASLQAAHTGAGLRLTSIGTNQKAHFSPDGKTLIYLSGARDAHKHVQVYEMSLSTFREKRITFHDGDCHDVDYSPTGEQLIYSSTTDELKERPRLLNQKIGTLPPTEIYLTDRKGSQIQRLTHAPGYQSEMSWVGANQVMYVSEHAGKTQIDRLTTKGAQTSNWGADQVASLRLPTVDASTTRVAWVIHKAGGGIMLGLKMDGKIQSLDIPFTEIQSLEWAMGHFKKPILILSAKKSANENLSGWILNPEKKCHAALISESGGNVKDLSVNKDQDRLVMTFETGGNSQLFLREFPSLPEICTPLDQTRRAKAPAN
jgi:Tol biopolymer transport system component